MKTLFAVLALAVVASAQPTITVQNRTIFVTSPKAIEAMELTVFDGMGHKDYKQWSVKLTAPLVGANQTWPLGPGSSVILLSVAYSDGTDWPQAKPVSSRTGGVRTVGARRLADFRNRFLADQEPDILDCDCGGATTMRVLGRMFQRSFPGRMLPNVMVGESPDLGKQPPAKNPGWFVRPVWTSIIYNGIPMSPDTFTNCNDPTFSEGGPDPIMISVMFAAACPLQYPYYPTTGVTANGADVCPAGSPMAVADVMVSAEPLYGPNGFYDGQPYCQSTWGFIASSAIDIWGETFEASMQNSCMLSNPIVTSPGGFGSCQGPGGIQ